jgi:hypothetical protein
MATYKLTVGDIAGIQLNIDSVTTKFDGQEFYVTMESLTYSKKIFVPSEIHTVLSVKAKKETTTSFPTLGELKSTFSKQLVTLKDGDTTVAENFFVYKMKPHRGKVSSSSAAMKVELFIFSFDKLLTIDKYCNAFTAKKLGGEIFKGELNKFILEGTTIDGSVNLQFLNYTSQVEKDDKGNEKTVEIRQPYLVQYNESFYDFLARSASRCGEMLYFEGGKLHLGMSANLDTASTDQTTVAESVDYENSVEEVLQVGDRHYNYFNHTDKDDNRYVDSAFQLLGAFDTTKDENPKTEKQEGKNKDDIVNKITTTTTTYFKKGTETEVVVTDLYTTSDNSPENQLAGEPKQKVSTLTLTENGKTGYLLKVTKTVKYSYVKDDKGNYKKEGKKFVYSTKTDSNVDGDTFPGIYNQPEPNDALFEELEKDKYTSVAAECDSWRVLLFRDFFLNLMDSTTLYDFFADAAEAEADSWLHATSDANAKNKENNEKNLTMDSNENPDQVNNNKYNLFSTLKAAWKEDNLAVNKSGDAVSLLMSAFYSKIRENTRKVSEVLVRLDYGANDKGLCLGDVIKVGSGEDDFYIVTKVELNDNGHYIVEAIPSFYKSVSKVTNTDNSVTYTISSFIPCPPLLPDVPSVRTSEAQVAFVENNLDPNKLGRVRVRYPWQTANGDCSPWVRMATPFATNGGGVTFKPEEGDEVLLNYEDGNIERPYIVGSLQSKYTTSFWGKLDDRVIQSRNGHTIKFEDKNSGEDFFVGWFPGIDIIKSYFPNTELLDFQGLNDLTGGISIKDRYGLYSIDLSSDGRVVDIKSSLGNVNLSAFTGINISAPNGNINIKGKNISIAASNKLSLESGSAIDDRFFNKDAFTSGSGVLNAVGGVIGDIADRTVMKLVDLSFIRSMLEVFLRPVDGTLKIKSSTFVLIEAGKGKTHIPSDQYNKPDSGSSIGTALDTKADPQVYTKLIKTIPILTSKANAICDGIKAAYKKVLDDITPYKTHQIDNTVVYNSLQKMKLDGNNSIVKKMKDNKGKAAKDVITEADFDFDNIAELKFKVKGDDNKKKVKPKDKNAPTYQQDLQDYQQYIADLDDDNTKIQPRRDDVVKLARTLGDSLAALFKAAEELSDFKFTAQQQNGTYHRQSLVDKIKKRDIFNKFIDKINQGTLDFNNPVDLDTTLDTEKKKLRRALIFDLIKDAEKNSDSLYSLKKGLSEPSDFSDDNKWKDFVMDVEEPNSSILGGLENYFRKRGVNDWIDATRNRKKWKADVAGKVLISDTPGKTLYFKQDEIISNNNVDELTVAHFMKLRRELNKVQ